MSSHPLEPLSIEERELAQRLARVGAPGEPSPALDSRILAAAHGAVAKRTPQRSRRESRWPVAFGVAASLALAVGIAWQLRPLPEPPPAYDEAAVAMVGATSMESAQPIADSASAADASAAAPSAPENVSGESPHATSARPTQAEAAANRPGAAVSASAVEKPVVVEKAQAADAQAAPRVPAPSPPPPASTIPVPPEFVPTPPAAAAAAAAAAAQQRERNESSTRTAATQQRASDAAVPARSAEAKDTSVLGTNTAAGNSEEGFDERPPTTAASPEVQQAWLQRIRALIADGEPDAARASLQEFKRRYPGVVLPDDLRRFDRGL